MHDEIDFVLTCDDLQHGRSEYNLHAMERLLPFLNHPAHVIVGLNRPNDRTLNHFKELKGKEIVHRLEILQIGGESGTKIQNALYNHVFSLVETEWIVHFDNDIFCYRKGYDDWVERIINLIESRYKNVGAVSHTIPYNRYKHEHNLLIPRPQVIDWVSTRFFVAEARTVKDAIDPALNDSDYHFESAIYYRGLKPRGLISIGLPFNPNFLILHIVGIGSWWHDERWTRYTLDLERRNQTLLKNIAHSDFGDISGDEQDCLREEYWGQGTWQTEPYDKEPIQVP